MSEVQVVDLMLYPVKSLRGISVDQLEITENGLRLPNANIHDRNYMVAHMAPEDEIVPRAKRRDWPKLATIGVAVEGDDVLLNAPGDQTPFRLSPPETAGRRVTVKAWGGDITGLYIDGSTEWLNHRLGYAAQILYIPDENRRLVDSVTKHPDEVAYAGPGTDGSQIHAVLLPSHRRFSNACEAQGLDTIPVGSYRANILFDAVNGETIPAWAEDNWVRLTATDGEQPVEIINRGGCTRCTSIEFHPETGEPNGDLLKKLGALANERANPKTDKINLGIWAAASQLSVGGLLRRGQHFQVETRAV